MWHPTHLTWEQVDKIVADSYREAGIRDPEAFEMGMELSKEEAEALREWGAKNPGKPLGLELAMQIDMMMGIQKAKEAAKKSPKTEG